MIDTLTYSGADGYALFCAKIKASGATNWPSDLPVVLLHDGGPDHQSLLPLGRLAALGMSDEIRTTEDFADAFAPAVGEFLASRQAGR